MGKVVAHIARLDAKRSASLVAGKTYSIGRNTEKWKVDVSIEVNTVSRHHGSISINSQGHAIWTVLPTKNGTSINGMRIEYPNNVSIFDGDIISLGPDIKLEFMKREGG